jgi:small subunit ribosomal protein S6
MSHSYEMMFILRPDLTEEQVSQQMRKYYDFLKEHGAEKLAIKVWGKRRLAYPIQKFQDGIYILVNYTGDGSQVAPLERTMRLSEEVIRYLTIKLRKALDIEETEIGEVKLSEIETKPQLPTINVSPEIQDTQVSEVTETPEANEVSETQVEKYEPTESVVVEA